MYAHFASSLNFFALSFCLSVTLASYVTAETRIMCGTEVDITAAPHLVSLRYKHNSSLPFIHRCSATIYSAELVLTTARCVIGLKPQQLQIVAGSSYRLQSIGYITLVNSIIIHPDFNIWFIDNDLALLRLQIPLTKSDWFAFEPIALSRSLPVNDAIATVAGWGGATEERADNSDRLQEASVRMLSAAECRQAYGEGRISKAMLCAGVVSPTGVVIDACRGDAGSTLVSNGLAVGLVSWSNGCGREGYPGVYTNLVYFKQWIESMAQQKL
ncbi:trypsin eta-like [Eurosta solidaginis]|uniref:trypsin eta-like n=1 Tax=Eurosta solidaginis TaxID=178769 RepID=UPI0035310C46